MNAVYGMFARPEQAQEAVDALRLAGVRAEEITVQSSEPLEEFEFGARDRKTAMSWFAALGAGVGMASGYFLTSVTQRAWPINTGGMPIVSNWTNVILIFEMTMLGAVLATLITLLVTARIPGRLPELYDADVSRGMILVGVANPGNAEAVARALREASAEVRRL